MRRLSLSAAIAGLSGGLALGCADRPTPTDLATDPLTPASRAEVVPAFAPIILGSNPLAVQAGYVAGITAADICTDPDEGLDQGFAKGQGVFTPAEGVHTRVLNRDVAVVVYEFGGPFISGACELADAPIVGTGTGKYVLNFNVTGPGAVAIHATVQGIVDLTSGGQARVLGTARVLILPDGTLKFDVEQVRLTPL